MLIEVAGDILLSKAEAIAHGVAPNDHMDRGLALALRERWPALAKDFRHYCHVQHAASGGAWTWKSADGLYIINLLTQEAAASEGTHPGRAKPEYVNHALRQLAQIVAKEGIRSLALPRLATGLGGLDFARVQPLLQQHLGELAIPVFVYSTYHPGQAADEVRAAGGQATFLRA
jgi:O-acetyl-ADP-ribose deacetylase (regulator of RNase III)